MPASSNAQDTRYAGDPLLLGAGARPLGMGSAFVALSDDAMAVYWNPAGLANITVREVQFQHAEQFGGSVNHDVLTVALPIPRGGLGIGIVRLGVDNIALTTLEDPTRPLGPDNRPIISQIVGTADYTLQVAYSRALRADLDVGATLKFLHRDLGAGTGSGFGFDLGLLYRRGRRLRLGAVLRNATRTRLTYDSGAKDTISPSLLIGTAYILPVRASDTLTGSFSLHVGEEKSSLAHAQGIRAGLEYRLKHRVAFRVGLQDGHLTLGTGLKMHRFALDLAFLEHSQLDNTYRISAALYF